MSEFTFYVIGWLVISASNTVIGLGLIVGGSLLLPHGSVVRKMGWAFLLHGLFGLGTVLFALVHQEAEWIRLLRTFIGVLFWPGIASAVIFVVYRVFKLSPADRKAVVLTHESVFGLATEMQKLKKQVNG